jgi:hypothetical protein
LAAEGVIEYTRFVTVLGMLIEGLDVCELLFRVDSAREPPMRSVHAVAQYLGKLRLSTST